MTSQPLSVATNSRMSLHVTEAIHVKNPQRRRKPRLQKHRETRSVPDVIYKHDSFLSKGPAKVPVITGRSWPSGPRPCP